MIQEHSLFNDCRFTDNKPATMVNEDPRLNLSARMNLNLGPETPELTVHARQQLKAMPPQKMREAVGRQSFNARIG